MCVCVVFSFLFFSFTTLASLQLLDIPHVQTTLQIACEAVRRQKQILRTAVNLTKCAKTALL